MNYKLIARGRHTYTTPRPGQYLKHPIQQLSHVLCGAGALLGREGSMRHGLTRRLCHADEPQYIRAKQLSMAATAWVIWLCAC